MMKKEMNMRFVVEKVLAPYGFCVVDTETGAVVETFKRKYMANAEAFHCNMTTMKTVTVLGTNTQVQIPVGTPHCCDPSTETYWSM